MKRGLPARKHFFLLTQLVARDFRLRYVGSLAGVFWSVLNPLLQLLLYTVVFSVVLGARLGESRDPGQFALYLFAALLPWISLQEGTLRSATSFIEHSTLIQRVRFPLYLLPLSLVCSSLLHQILGIAVFFIILLSAGIFGGFNLVLIVPLLAFQFLLMAGMAMGAASTTVYIRDLTQVLGVLLMLIFWLTPIVYAQSAAPEHLQWVFDLNPLTHMMEGYRFALLGTPRPSLPGLLFWALFSLSIFWIGVLLLRRTRKEIVDLV